MLTWKDFNFRTLVLYNLGGGGISRWLIRWTPIYARWQFQPSKEKLGIVNIIFVVVIVVAAASVAAAAAVVIVVL